MTMENLNKEGTEVEGEVKTEVTQETEVKKSPVEEAARASGWVSKEEWEASGKDPAEWRTAREYQERGELFEEIHKLKDVNKKTAAAFKVLVEHHKKVRETAVAEAIAKLKQEKKVALENHEIERVFQIDEELEQVRNKPADLPEVEIPDVESGPSPTFKSWHKKNQWYQLSGEDEASDYANMVGAKYRAAHKDATEQEFLEHVESKVARRFPELFENPNSNRKPEVNSSDNDTTKSLGSFKLTEQEENVCKMLVAQGVMTRKQYVDEIKKVRSAE